MEEIIITDKCGFIPVPGNLNFKVPQKSTAYSACFDMSYSGSEPLVIHPYQSRRWWQRFGKPHILAVPLGLIACMPAGYELLLRPRSGLALKNGITLLNSPATIDADYDKEVKAILINLGSESYTFVPGSRVCQGIFRDLGNIQFDGQIDPERVRTGGFGSTGV